MRRVWPLLVLGAGLLTACSAGSPSSAEQTGPGQPVLTTTANALDLPRMRLAENFISAVNMGRVSDAMAMLWEFPVVSDCDYAHHHAVAYTGQAEVRSWIQQQVADHNHFVLAALENADPDPNQSAVGVRFAGRTSDSLRALGFNHGVRPGTDAKVRFKQGPHGERIEAFANGPIGGDPTECTHPQAAP